MPKASLASFAILLTACGFICDPSQASDSTSGQVVNPTMVNNGPIYFTQSGTRSTPPACATDPRWIIDNTATGATNMYAAILSARMSGQKVIIQGTGTCLSGTSNETVAWVVIDG